MYLKNTNNKTPFITHDFNMTTGITLLEFLIVTAVAAIILTIVFSTFTTFRNNQLLTAYSESITATLQEARLNTVSSKGDKQYGVHFESDKYVLFEGTTYSSSDTSNKEVGIRTSVEISPISLNGGGNDVLFERLLGKTSQYGTVVLTLKSDTSTTRTISIDQTGTINSAQ